MDTLQRPPTHRDGGRVGRRHTRQVARAHEGREHVAGAPELDAQDGRLGGQKDNARARRPERDVQQQVERHAHRGRRDARHCHLPLAAQRRQDAHRHKVADARHEAHRTDDPHRCHRAGKRLAGHERDHGLGEHQQVAHHRHADVHRETKARAHQPAKPRYVVSHLVMRYPGHEYPRHRTDHTALHMLSFYKAQSAWRERDHEMGASSIKAQNTSRSYAGLFRTGIFFKIPNNTSMFDIE